MSWPDGNPTGKQIDNMLLKKNLQVAFTNVDTLIDSEKIGSSALKIVSKNVWSQKIPDKATFDENKLCVYTNGVQTYSSYPINIPNLSIPQVGTGSGIKITKTPLGGSWRVGTNDTIGLYGNKYID